MGGWGGGGGGGGVGVGGGGWGGVLRWKGWPYLVSSILE